MKFFMKVELALGMALIINSVMAAEPPKPKITMEQARAIALKQAKGTIAKEEYEEEKGAWRYSFDIKEGNRIHEIGVDSNTGKVVEDAWEDKEEGKKD